MSTALEAELLVHLDTQIASARRLLGSCSSRARRSAPATSTPCSPASPTSRPRWAAAAASSRTAPGCCSAPASRSASGRRQVTLEGLCALVSPAPPQTARDRSAELRGLLAEIAREHGINRALMRQELAFLAHLTRLIGHEPEAGYGTPRRRGPAPAPRRPSTASSTSRRRSCRSPRSTASRPRCAACSPSSACWTRPATTSPTRRPRATRARRSRSSRPPRSRSRPAASSAAPARTSARASTCSRFRRVRDQFVDLQYRAQNTNLGEWAARTETLDRAELGAHRARRERHQRAARAVLGRVVVLSAGDATRPPLKQTLAETAGRSPARSRPSTRRSS